MTKLNNEYSDMIGFADQIPKTVLAAMVVSMLSNGGDHLGTEAGIQKVREAIATEWQDLYTCGIVSQKPKGRAVNFIKETV